MINAEVWLGFMFFCALIALAVYAYWGVAAVWGSGSVRQRTRRPLVATVVLWITLCLVSACMAGCSCTIQIGCEGVAAVSNSDKDMSEGMATVAGAAVGLAATQLGK